MTHANHDYERMLLGALLHWPKSMLHHLAEIEPEDMDLEPHRHIVTAMKSCIESRKPVQAPVVYAELKRLGLHEVVGGPQFLTQLAQDQQVKEGIEYVATRIKALGGLRRFEGSLIDALTAVRGETPGDPEAVVSELMSRIALAAASAQSGGGFIRFDEAIMEGLGEYEANIGKEPGITTGLPQLDSFFRPCPGDLVVVGARPGMGKTSLMLQILRGPGAMDHGGPIALFSLEMRGGELAIRLVAERAGVSPSQLRTTIGSRQMFDRLRVAAGEIADWPVWINPTPGMTIEQMQAGAQRLEMREGPLAVVAIDYLQICGHSRHTLKDSVANRLGHITKGAKALAKDRRCPVLIGSQLSREGAKSGRKPGNHDLRDSGSIESDADAIVFIHGDENEWGARVDRELLVTKSRHGRKGRIECVFEGKTTRFVEKV